MDITFYRSQDRAREVKRLHAKATIGSSGAITLNDGYKGIKSITKESTAGQYTIELVDSAYELLMVRHLLQSATINGASMQLLSETVRTDGKFKVQFFKATSSSDTTPIAANLTSGDVLKFEITIKNGSF